MTPGCRKQKLVAPTFCNLRIHPTPRDLVPRILAKKLVFKKRERTPHYLNDRGTAFGISLPRRGVEAVEAKMSNG